MKPLILVTSDVVQTGGYNWHGAIDTYLNAVSNISGAQPIILPDLTSETDFDSVLSRVDGVLATGSKSNVSPNAYGQTETTKHEPFDHDRDATTLPLIRAAIVQGKPLLAICRGHQELNVALGGTLYTEIQEISGTMDHRAVNHPEQDVRYKIAHTVTPVSDGQLARIVGNAPIAVNSLHRQAIDRLAVGLSVEATADDGTIEAISVDGAKAFALGVQWHPEYWAASDPVSTQIFEYFGTVVRGG